MASSVNQVVSIDDDDDELIEFILYINHPRINHLNKWDDTDFLRRFRMKTSTFMFILEKISDRITTPTNRNKAIQPVEKLLVALRFDATGNFLITAGELVGISELSACRVVKEISNAIAALWPEFIKMPQTPDELRNISEEFYKIAKIPRVIGATDCTHIRIHSPVPKIFVFAALELNNFQNQH